MSIKKPIKIVAPCVIVGVALFVYMDQGHSHAPDTPPPNCSNGRPSDISLKDSNNSTLRKLAEYEAVCKGAVVDELMLFAAMPRSENEAAIQAKQTATALHSFANHKIPPLVIFEPSLTSNIALANFHRGAYDRALTIYYQELKKYGVTDKEMGTWVLFPEANTPIWGTTEPKDFVKNVAKVGLIQKTVFPDSKVSILLNSRTYPNGDTQWSHGKITSLAPYLRDLPNNLIDRIGYQGFPSMAAADATYQYRQLDAVDFLPAHIIKDAAYILNTKSVWINTGTFSRMHTDRPSSEVRLAADERRRILQGILQQITALQAAGLHVSVNLFAENKALMNEHVDWSYWDTGKATKSPNKDVFVWFVHQIRTNQMNFSLYDSM